MSPIFPTHLFNPNSTKLSVVGRTVQSPPSISGAGQVLRTDGGGFRLCQMSGISLRINDQLRAWNAWEGVLQGGITRVTVPVATQRLAPRPLQGGTIARYGSLHANTDDPYFPEITGYGSPQVVAVLNASALYRDNQVSINIQQGSRIKGGETFSINHSVAGHHIYKISRVLSRNSQIALVQIDMPLRQATPSGTPVNFDWPLMDAVLVPETDISLDISFVGSEVSISFREAI